MRTLFLDKTDKKCGTILRLLGAAAILLTISSYTQAAAPPRAKPYAESKCNTDPNVFFCEDFEGEDIVNYGNNNCGSTWGNPAIQKKDGTTPANFCWSGGGSYQYNTQTLPGFSATNRVWRVTKTTSFTDVVTGRNTGTGSGTISGWFNPNILGTAKTEWWGRIQVWFSPDHTWPDDYDFKMLFALPRDYVDAPSAAYEAGMYFHQDFWCSGYGNFNDVPAIRYSSNFAMFPYHNEYCPPLSAGQTPDGVHAPRFQKGRWYTLEYHVKLAPSNAGVLDLWVNGVKAYSTNRMTCANGCPDMGTVYIMGWMNSADKQTGYYEIDNIVMSRNYIGLPGGASSSTPPTAPGNLSLTAP